MFKGSSRRAFSLVARAKGAVYLNFGTNATKARNSIPEGTKRFPPIQSFFSPYTLTESLEHISKSYPRTLLVACQKNFLKRQKSWRRRRHHFFPFSLSDVSNTHSPTSTPFPPNPFSISSDTHNFATFRHFTTGIVFVMLALGSVF